MAKTEMYVTGVQKSKGEVEGRPYDYAKIFVALMLPPTDENKNGYAGGELRGVPDIYEEYLKYPFKREGVVFSLDIEKVATGKGNTSDMVLSMTPVDQQAQSKKAA